MKFIEDIRARGLVHQFSSDELLDRLDVGGMTAYIGFDPSADSLHVGSLLPLVMLRRLQIGGHTPIAVAGGGTGMIGDPSGKSEERNLLTDEVLDRNLVGIKAQIERFVDVSESAGGARILDNRTWLGELKVVEFLRDVGKFFSVNQMIQRDSVRARLEEREQGISYTEFSYQVLQAYDFLRLNDLYNCELQIGGSDQWGNIVSGVDLIRRMRQRQAYGLTLPLVTKADGKKFGKSESGTIWLDGEKTSPYSLYQFCVRTEDDMVGSYLRMLTLIPLSQIEEVERESSRTPEGRIGQKVFARAIVEMVHGVNQAIRAEEASDALFAGSLLDKDEEIIKLALSEAPTIKLDWDQLAKGIPAEEILLSSGLATSRSDARRILSQGGGYMNDQRLSQDKVAGTSDLIFEKILVLRKGKRDYCLVEVERR